ncbi:MAG TPA: rhomboid family intramembrane serine protease [Virgibacillus sp.]|nr:rhomboid family intramembrane serine protease [Virgibacillus sp.]
MYIQDQYSMYRLVHTLLSNGDYELIHINPQIEEIWLEKYEKRTSHVVRLIHRGFDWKNHLKADISSVFRKANAMRRFFRGKSIQLYNVYVSSHAPVDEWEELKKPLRLNEKRPLSMQIFYLDRNHFDEEYRRFQQVIGVETADNFALPSEWEAEQFVETYKQSLVKMEQDEKEEVKRVFSFGKPRLTFVLIIVNVLLFMLLEGSGSSTNIEHLIEFGAKYNPAIIDGEWWRIISSMFLHIGMLHLMMNMLALYYLGTAVERIYGSWRFFIIYLLAGIGGGLASFAFTINVSAGASGAIFGLFGALLFFGLIHKKLFFQTMGRNLLFLVGFNIVFGFVVPQIDNGAHLGGLLCGFLASAILHLPKRRSFKKQLGALLIYVLMIAGLIVYGTETHANSSFYQLYKIEGLLENGQYEEVIESATLGLEESDQFEAELLFQRGYAHIKLGETEQAIHDLEKCTEFIEDNPEIEIPQAFYNLALLYYETNDIGLAKEAITKAVQLDPNNEDFQNVYDKIME